MVWHQIGDNPLSRPLIIYFSDKFIRNNSRSQWVNQELFSTRAKEQNEAMCIFHGIYCTRNRHPKVNNPSSSTHSAACMRQWIGSALVEIMVCRLFGVKPLFKPMLVFVHWTLRKKHSEILIKYKIFQSRKCIWKYRLRNGGHFVQGEMS